MNSSTIDSRDKIPVSTAGRIFAAQLTRDLAERQRKAAALLHPGATTWSQAFHGFIDSLQGTNSPIKAANKFWQARDRLIQAQRSDACFVNCYQRRSRSGYFHVLTYRVSKHPQVSVDQKDGIKIDSYHCMLQRNGRLAIAGEPVAFASWHALSRMKERSTIDIFQASGVVSFCGIAGLLMREGTNHLNRQVNVAFENLICTGVLRPAPQAGVDGYYDVLTVLSRDLATSTMLNQGTQVAHAVMDYIKGLSADPHGYADKIAQLPVYDRDFVSRTLAQQNGGNDAG
jgi:hypothetical protein